jgi:hypothetical protein
MKSFRFKIARIIASAALILLPMAVPIAVHADSIQGSVCSGASLDLSGASQSCATTTGASGLTTILKAVIIIF